MNLSLQRRFVSWRNFISFYTVSAQINLQRFIKILHFQGGGLLKFFPIFGQKAKKSGLLGKKSVDLLEFCIGGGLIKSGGLFSQMQ